MHGRAKQSPHKHPEESIIPIVQIYCFFLRTAHDAAVITCVSVIDVVNGCGACTQVKAKGSSDTHAVGYIVKHLEHAGLNGELILQTDSESSVKDLARAIANKRQVDGSSPKTHLRQTPIASKQSNGTVERFHQSIEGLVRTQKLALEGH